MPAPSPELFEKLASFYLGRHYDLAANKLQEQLLLYDAKDLCTHAMCVGMTGSGKTGLCLSLLEEAAIDGVPAICIDPKGDLGNLLLSFPDLQPSDFEPWLGPADAARKGLTLREFARETAKTWKAGLAAWGQTPERINKFRDSVEASIYTPGSTIGLPLTVLKSFDAPPADVLNNAELFSERVAGATSGLLTLMGVDADPLLSPEHILIASILDHLWRQGRSVSIGDLIGLIQSPPIERVGVLDLETFMSAAKRSKLAMQLNNLLASPAFRTWIDGESLSISRLLHTDAGKPRLTILSIAHLSERERMFFVTILLNELIAWMRQQSGTGSLRALLYMDEVAGYFPPVANPPSKPPMLTLLKQARAYGLGVVLATQNPVDLDYKGLSNMGTWFLGRLQTERDKARVLDGLEGASVQTGQAFNRAATEQMLAALGNRVFLMNNVHDNQPTVFQTRWAMSFLAGPLARTQISRLMDPQRKAVSHDAAAGDSVRDEPFTPSRPVAPSGVEEKFLTPTASPLHGSRTIYRPAVYAEGTVHYVRSSTHLDRWADVRLLVPCGQGVPKDLWRASKPLTTTAELASEPEEGFEFAELPSDLASATNFRSFSKDLKDHLYRHRTTTLFKSPKLKAYAPDGSDESDARVHFTQLAREARDLETEKLRNRYASKERSLEKKILTATQRVARETDQYSQARLSSLLNFGSSLLGAFLGRKIMSRTNVSKMSTAARGAGRAAQQHGDVERAEQILADLEQEKAELESELEKELITLAEDYEVENLELEEIVVKPRKSDLNVGVVALAWTPWQVDSSGIASPLY